MSNILSQNEKKNLISLIVELGVETENIKKEISNFSLKDDNSPVTKADFLVNKELNRFCKKTSTLNIISEENAKVSFKHRSQWEYYWHIDPIDGTKEFITKGEDYTINIALCKKNRPIFSLVYAPSRKELFYAEKGQGAFKNNQRILINKSTKKRKLNLVASKSHINQETSLFIESLSKIYDVRTVQFGSSLKICKVAEGAADLYPRFGPTMEWDTCAADLVINEAGGYMQDLKKNRLEYNKQNLLNPFFIVSAIKNFEL